MSLFWPFSFFNYVVERYVNQLDLVVPWFSMTLRWSLLLISAAVTFLTPFFWFVTIINNTDAFHVRVAVSVIHSIWWSLLLSFVGTGVFMVLLGAPALTFDVYVRYGLIPLCAGLCSIVIVAMLASRLRGSTEPVRERHRRRKK